MSTIVALFRARGAHLPDAGGSLASARERENLSRRIWSDFDIHARLKEELSRGAAVPAPEGRGEAAHLAALGAAGLLLRDGATYRAPNAAARAYIGGRWLEELIACALLDAGADEVRYGQRIEWRGAGGAPSCNEIDVIARAGRRLALVSCKAMRPLIAETDRGEDRLLDAIEEADRWSDRFADSLALPALATTSDLYDEGARRFRSDRVARRARALRVWVMPADLGAYPSLAASTARLVDALRDADRDVSALSPR